LDIVRLRFGKKQSRAAAAVELAIVAPLLFTILFGIIEFGWMFTIKNTMVNAAREGARVGALQSSEYADIVARVDALMTPLGLTAPVTYSIVEATDENPFVSVTLTVPQADVSLVGNFFADYLTGDIRGTASMRKEGF
jgi:Flp pilus assembly protein TadG